MWESESEKKTDLEQQADSILELDCPGRYQGKYPILSDYGYNKRRAHEYPIDGVEYGKKLAPVSGGLLTKARIRKIRQALELVFPLLEKAEAKGFSRIDVLQALREAC